jgi:hypothetical protein
MRIVLSLRSKDVNQILTIVLKDCVLEFYWFSIQPLGLMNWAGFGRERWWPKWGIFLNGLGKTMKTSARIAGVLAEIRT